MGRMALDVEHLSLRLRYEPFYAATGALDGCDRITGRLDRMAQHNFKLEIMLNGTPKQGCPRDDQEETYVQIEFKGYTVHASKEEPQYLIKSDKTDHMAMHKGSALKLITKRKQ